MAAAISYYTFVSLVPLLVLAVVVAVFVGGQPLENRILELAGENLVPAGQQSVETALADRTGQGGIGVVSFLVTAWGALKIFRGVDSAFTRIYGSTKQGLVDQVRDAALTLTSIGAGLIGAAALTTVLNVLDVPYLGLLSPVLLLLTLCVAFFPFYYVIPDVDVTPGEALPGTVFAAVGWTLLGVVFGIYTSVSAGVAGALGGILLLVTWFYFAGVLLLTGAMVNAVLGDRIQGPDGDAPGTGGDGSGGGPGAERATRAAGAEPGDRQLQHPGGRHAGRTDMSEDRADESPRGDADDVEPRGAADISELESRVEELRADLDHFQEDVTERTVEKPRLEEELKQYVRSRMRRGKARGWGPYLVLLYGTVMTLGAFYFLEGVWAILAMVVLFLSTLGLYVLFVMVGVGLNAVEVPGRAVDAVRERRR